MPEAITAPRAPSRADYQAAAERLGAGKSAELAGWTIVKDAHAHYWRAYRETPCSIVVSSASAVDLSVALTTHDQGAASSDALIVAGTTRAWIEDQRRRFHGGVGGYEEHYRQARINSVNHLAECVELALNAGEPADAAMLAEVSQGIARRWYQSRKLPYETALVAFSELAAAEERAEAAEAERDRLRGHLDQMVELFEAGAYEIEESDTGEIGVLICQCSHDELVKRLDAARAALGVSDER